jgi:hypothetical protein
MNFYPFLALTIGPLLVLSAIITIRRRRQQGFYANAGGQDAADAPWGQEQPASFYPTSHVDAEYSVTPLHDTDLDHPR